MKLGEQGGGGRVWGNWRRGKTMIKIYCIKILLVKIDDKCEQVKMAT